MITKLAIIGAGLAGVTLGQRLQHVADVTIFEKSRGLGGRMATRRAADHHFDHGAQYFTVHSDRFADFLRPFLDDGTVVQWVPRVAEVSASGLRPVRWTSRRYVAQPGMNALCKAIVARNSLCVNRATRIANIKASGARWALLSDGGAECGVFDWVISTAPAEQSAQLVPAGFSGSGALRQARMQGCYSLMLGGCGYATGDWDALIVRNSPVAWIARSNSKLHRPDTDGLIVQSCNDWADVHIETDQAQVQSVLTGEVARLTGVPAQAAKYASLHRWRFAKVARPSGQLYLCDPEQGLAAAGDWCGPGRVESAFESGDGLAEHIKGYIQ